MKRVAVEKDNGKVVFATGYGAGSVPGHFGGSNPAMSTVGPRWRRGCGIVRVLSGIVMVLGVAAVAFQAHAADPRVDVLKFVPELPQTGDNLKIKMRFAGGANRAEVRWVLNGEEVRQSDVYDYSPTADLDADIKSGDTIKVEVTPYADFGQKGHTITKTVVCQNAPPNLKLGGQDLQGETYVAKVDAEDPEGRGVTFTLRQGPDGMKIDGGGQIRWEMPKGTSGKFTVKVAAKDEEGGEAVLSYTFTIRR